MLQKAWSWTQFAWFVYKLLWHAFWAPPHRDSFNFGLLIFKYFFMFCWLFLLAHYLIELAIWLGKDRIPALLMKLFLLFGMINQWCLRHLLLFLWLFLWRFYFLFNFYSFFRLFFVVLRNYLDLLSYFLFFYWLFLGLRFIVIFHWEHAKYYIW